MMPDSAVAVPDVNHRILAQLGPGVGRRAGGRSEAESTGCSIAELNGKATTSFTAAT